MESGSNVVKAVVLVIVAATACVALNAWLIMLAWGVLASAFGFSTVGYGASVLVTLGLGVVGGLVRGVRISK